MEGIKAALVLGKLLTWKSSSWIVRKKPGLSICQTMFITAQLHDFVWIIVNKSINVMIPSLHHHKNKSILILPI